MWASGSIDQKIKALCYQQLLQKNNQEDNIVKTIAVFTNQIHTTSGVEQLVWHSLLADVYLEHYQNYRWQLGNRTKLQQAPTNINEWSADNYYNAITTHYLASIVNEKELQKTATTKYKAIIEPGKNADNIYINMYACVYI